MRAGEHDRVEPGARACDRGGYRFDTVELFFGEVAADIRSARKTQLLRGTRSASCAGMRSARLAAR